MVFPVMFMACQDYIPLEIEPLHDKTNTIKDSDSLMGSLEPRHEKTCCLHMRKQRRRSFERRAADQLLCFTS